MLNPIRNLCVALVAAGVTFVSGCGGGGGGGGFVLVPTAVFTTDQEAQDVVEELFLAVFEPLILALAFDSAIASIEGDTIDPNDFSCLSGNPGTVQLQIVSASAIRIVFNNCVDLQQNGSTIIAGTFDGSLEVTLLASNATSFEVTFEVESFFFDDGIDDVNDANGLLGLKFTETPVAPPDFDVETVISAQDLTFELNGNARSFRRLRFVWFEAANGINQFTYGGAYVLQGAVSNGDIVTFSTEDDLIFDFNGDGRYDSGLFRVNGADDRFVDVELQDGSCDASVVRDLDADGLADLPSPIFWALTTIGLDQLVDGNLNCP